MDEDQMDRRTGYNRVMAPVGAFIAKFGVSPLALDLIGLVAGLISAFWIGRGDHLAAAVALLLSGIADSLDGMVARALKEESAFGAFFDSVLDRYVDTAVLLGLAWYFMGRNLPLYLFLTFAAAIGVVMTSFSRARAQEVGLTSRFVRFKIGPERLTFLLLIGLFFPSTLLAVTWVLAILSNLIAFRRMIAYYPLTPSGPSGGTSE